MPRSLSNQSQINHALLAAVLVASPAVANDLPVMPLPASVQASAGALPVGPGFRVSKGAYRDQIIDGGVDRLIARLRAKTGLDIKFAPGAEAESTLLVRCKGPTRSSCLQTPTKPTGSLSRRPTPSWRQTGLRAFSEAWSHSRSSCGRPPPGSRRRASRSPTARAFPGAA